MCQPSISGTPPLTYKFGPTHRLIPIRITIIAIAVAAFFEAIQITWLRGFSLFVDSSKSFTPPLLTLLLSGIAFVWTNIYYMCLGKPGGSWRSPGLKFAPEAALRCQALPLSKRLSLWSEWMRQKRVSGWILRDEETERDDEGNRRGNDLFIPFSLLNLLVL